MNMILEAKADIVDTITEEKRFCKGKKYPVCRILKGRSGPINKKEYHSFITVVDERGIKTLIQLDCELMNNFVAHWNNK